MGVQTSCCRPEADCDKSALEAAEPRIKRVFDENGIDEAFEFVYDKGIGDATGGASGSQSQGSAVHALEKVPLDKAEHKRLKIRLEELTKLLLADEEEAFDFWCPDDEGEGLLHPIELRSSHAQLFAVSDIISLDGDLMPRLARELSECESEAIWQEIDETCLHGPSTTEDFNKARTVPEQQKHETVYEGEQISTKLTKNTGDRRSKPKSKNPAKAKKNVARLQQLAPAQLESTAEAKPQLEEPVKTYKDSPDGAKVSKDLPDAARARELDMEVLQADPKRKSLQIRLERGELRLRLLDLEGAIEDFDKVIRVAPASAPALRLRGLAKLQKGDAFNLQGAQDDFQGAANLGDAKAMSLHQMVVSRTQEAACPAQN